MRPAPILRAGIRLALVAALASAPPAGEAGAGPPEAIWGRAILPQPFDAGPFRQVRIPGWVEDTPGCGYTLSVMDRPARERAVAHGVTISEMGFVNPRFACYDSRLIRRRSRDWPDGRIEREIAEYRRLGLRILGVYPPSLQGEVYEEHPAWRRVATDTTEIPQIDMQESPHGGMLCLLGPYGDFVIEVLAEILTRFPEVDAFSFGGLHLGGVCYCRSCREAYRRDAGGEIPDADLDDPAFRRYQHWADRRMEALIGRMQHRLKSIKPEVALVTWTTNAGRFGHLLSIPRNMPARMNLLLDAPDQEFWLDETNRGTTVGPAFANSSIWALTNHRVAFSEPYLMSHGNPYGKDSFPPHEILRRMLLAVTHGAAPSIAVAQPPRLQDELYRWMDEARRRRPWLTHKRPEPWAALVMSDNTRNFYGRSPGAVEERCCASVLGTFRVCLEEHLPVAIVNDWNLDPDDLAPYKVLILPNTACLDDRQVAAIDGFVRGGGGLVASLDASLFNEFGDPRPEFALAGAFGVRHRGLYAAGPDRPEPIDVNFARALPADYWEKRKGVFDFRQDPASFLNRGLMGTYVGRDPVSFKGQAVRVEVADEDATRPAVIRRRALPDSSEGPAVVARTHGRGRVAYFAAGLDSAYYLYPYPYQRIALRNAIEWAAAAPAPVRVEAPMCVQANVVRQEKDGARRLIVHLFNDVNTTAHHALPADDVPLREEVIPTHDIRVSFAEGYRIDRLHLEPSGEVLKDCSGGRGKSVVVPRLDVHAMVVAELAADSP